MQTELTFMQALMLIFIAAAGTGVVITREPLRQAIAISFYGLLLSVMFFLFQAPDVALSQLVVGAVALPLMMVLALARVRRNEEMRQKADGKKD
jgi:energy-converting hydrogenase B subunit D